MNSNRREGAKAFTIVLDERVMDRYEEKFLDAKKKAIKLNKKFNKQDFASFFFGKLIPNINVTEFLETI